jgi:hypothetical protein
MISFKELMEGRAGPEYKTIFKLLKKKKMVGVDLSDGRIGWCSIESLDQIDRSSDRFVCNDQDGEVHELSYDDIARVYEI